MFTRLRGLLVALILTFPWAAAAQQTMTVDDVVGYKAVSSPAVSPDGRATVFVVREADLDGNRLPAPVAPGRGAGPSPDHLRGAQRLAAVAPDGRAVAFLSNRGDETEIYLMPRDGGEARPVTRHATGIQAFRWSPDGRTIAFRPDPQSEQLSSREKAGPTRSWSTRNSTGRSCGSWTSSRAGDALVNDDITSGVRGRPTGRGSRSGGPADGAPRSHPPRGSTWWRTVGVTADRQRRGEADLWSADG
jgi:dipeptidyl aminopeptidase/acylaminoacyl peptidase